MAVVYLARDLKHGRRVALKVIRAEQADATGLARFRREILTAANLQHPHILGVFDSGEADGLLWFTMPFVEGENLRERLARTGPLGASEVARIIRQAAQGLAHAHEQGVVHRDVKPANLLLTKDGTVLVADFGIARAAAGLQGLPDTGATQMTQAGFAVGTPDYMAPEQRFGAEADARTDVWALAAVAFELLTGQVAAKVIGPGGTVPTLRADIPAGLAHGIRRALASDPAQRLPSMREFADVLGEPESSPRATTQPRPRRPLLIGVAVVLIAAIAAGAAAWNSRRGTTAAAADSAAAPLRIAVLPFENQGDTSQAYFADGIADAVRGKLAEVPGMQVIARTSVAQYRGTGKSPEEIARELGVDFVLAGTVRWAVDADGRRQVQVNPELIEITDAALPTYRWQQAFARPLTDVFAVQGEIATQVATALNVELNSSTRNALAQAPTQDLDAYGLFLQGRAAAINSRAAGSMLEAARFFEQAVARDTTFGIAWADLATARLNQWRRSPTPELVVAAEEALSRAERLAPDKPQTLGARTNFLVNIKGDTAAARRLIDQHMSAASRDPALLRLRAGLYQVEGRHQDALRLREQSLALDPRSVQALRGVADSYRLLGDQARARIHLRAAQVMTPRDPSTANAIIISWLTEGRLDSARVEYRRSRDLIGAAVLAPYMSTYGDIFWLLDPADQALVLTLPTEAFDGDAATRAIIRAQLYGLRGDRASAAIWADSASRYLGQQLAEQTRQDVERVATRGLALAYAGRTDEALAATTRARASTVNATLAPYLAYLHARVLALTDRKAQAIATLDTLSRSPRFPPPYLALDPAFAPLRGMPAFEAIIGRR